MKKIGMLMCMLGMALGLHAQNFEIYVNGAKVNNGDVLTMNFATTSAEEPLHVYTIFKNTGSSDITLTGTKEANLPEALKDKDMWCIWGACQGAAAEADQALKPGEMFAGKTEYLAITPEGYVGDEGKITYTFSTKEQPESKISFTVQWDLVAAPAGRMKMMLEKELIADGGFYEREFILSGDPDEMLKIYTTLENPSQETVIVAATKKSFLGQGAEDGWCMLGNCWGNTINAVDYPIEPGKTVTTIAGTDEQYFDYTPNGYEGVSYVYYTFYDKNNMDNRLNFAIAWKTKEGTANERVADAIHSSVYPNPAAETARLTWGAAAGNVVLNVRNVSGVLVYSRNVEGRTSAEIKVDTWTPGLYFYTLERQGERLGGGKLLVR